MSDPIRRDLENKQFVRSLIFRLVDGGYTINEMLFWRAPPLNTGSDEARTIVDNKPSFKYLYATERIKSRSIRYLIYGQTNTILYLFELFLTCIANSRGINRFFVFVFLRNENSNWHICHGDMLWWRRQVSVFSISSFAELGFVQSSEWNSLPILLISSIWVAAVVAAATVPVSPLAGSSTWILLSTSTSLEPLPGLPSLAAAFLTMSGTISEDSVSLM